MNSSPNPFVQAFFRPSSLSLVTPAAWIALAGLVDLNFTPKYYLEIEIEVIVDVLD